MHTVHHVIKIMLYQQCAKYLYKGAFHSKFLEND